MFILWLVIPVEGCCSILANLVECELFLDVDWSLTKSELISWSHPDILITQMAYCNLWNKMKGNENL